MGDLILMTAAHNEAAYIERTIESVTAQTTLPALWVIVSDGSTDGTDGIVRSYAEKYGFIRFVRVDGDGGGVPRLGRIAYRKVRALRQGLQALGAVESLYVANLDGDTTVPHDYYERILGMFAGEPRLGIAGGFVYDVVAGRQIPAFTNPYNVGGMCQVFRRRCWEDIGGYVPAGHEDSVALVMARMKGWQVRSSPSLRVLHHKVPAAASGWRSRVRASHRLGRYDRIMGDSIPWELARCAAAAAERPFLLVSLARLYGYALSAAADGMVLPAEAIKFVRREQRRKLVASVGIGSRRLRGERS